jgi:predicted nuclease of predicted toxin-antitoxin system
VNFLGLLLDENISPSLVPLMWGQGFDAIAVRDRGMLRASDLTVWRRAAEENRVLVTINEADFRKFAVTTVDHPGLIVIPSGGSRQRQLEFIISAVTYVQESLPNGDPFRGLIISVDESCNVILAASAGASRAGASVMPGSK